MNYKKVLIGSLSAVALLGTSLLPVFAEDVTKDAKLSASVPAGEVSFNKVDDLDFGEGKADLVNHDYTFTNQTANFTVDNSTGSDAKFNVSVSSPTVTGLTSDPATVDINALSSATGSVATSLTMNAGDKTVTDATMVYTLTPVTVAE
ncbi:hypothetical protein [Weissella paramesenteroides]|uniref:hypothetical protein n=1 Tax=Weissella paramesenteroides TaxID=1249 RepID=UPI0023F67FCF|nr:hypothetical protein [Weissella paramesenteroides]MDF8373936.1 hypothetical protein [Weissella paramesenteroides]WIG65439.1 hypothetical protein G9U56_00010 [Weissella paramesenteroides]